MVDPEFGVYPWAFAPPQCNFAAMESDGHAYWLQGVEAVIKNNMWIPRGESVDLCIMGTAPTSWPRDRWRESLRARPA